MKLLTRTTLWYLLFSGVVFIICSIIFYNILHHIFKRQLDENLTEEKLLIEQTINYSDSVPDFRLVFGHMIDVTILNEPQENAGYIKDTLMYDTEMGEFASFRHLYAENTSIRNKGYIINIYKPLRESEQLIAEIVFSLAMVFVSLLLTLVIVNYFTTRRLWIPFYRTLHDLTRYDINQANPIVPAPSVIYEFNLLNQAIGKMSEKIRQDYMNLKEFNENAAHELQTPLAIIKSKLELLIQSENLDENQLRIISGAFDATTRMSKLIQGLLLISKIENNQFLQTEELRLDRLLDAAFNHFEELITHRKLTLTRDYQYSLIVKINPLLAEILITNLVSNAIKHNIMNGRIEVITKPGLLTITNTGQPLRSDPSELFKRFRKAGDNPDSVGLGLAIVQKIASLYKMRINYLNTNEIHILQVSIE